ncbi:hypothetical protein HYQ03_gp61 [Arthrobacter phage Kuleana]|uniref:Uncharacterized protein n=1 Tax=Arthrobacter phage Kuleana TaxID=2653270 RepID=A0A5Q2WEQ1_9CAUD|nr:hypothetical protein HYQ03_gp61 [Arthrobacter phage Kuleana]QGH74548.1 hypothetical protein SEA_KULEANA_61 [Arthrobacter phage Kuleana]
MIRVVALATCQFSWGGLFSTNAVDPKIHLVRMTATAGFAGPTLCGIDRFDKDGPGFSMGGGVTGPGIAPVPCPGCERAAGLDYPQAPIWGATFADVFRRHRKAPWSVGNLPVLAVEERK